MLLRENKILQTKIQRTGGKCICILPILCGFSSAAAPGRRRSRIVHFRTAVARWRGRFCTNTSLRTENKSLTNAHSPLATRINNAFRLQQARIQVAFDRFELPVSSGIRRNHACSVSCVRAFTALERGAA
jgi:hypothetical protein